MSELNTTFTNTLPENCSVVGRFKKSFDNMWDYFGNVEAIQFKASSDIRLFGIGLYGDGGQFKANLKLFHLRNGDDQLRKVVASMDNLSYEARPPAVVAPICFSEPILIQANIWHTISAHITKPGTKTRYRKGDFGYGNINTDGVMFTFRDSLAIADNGSSVAQGQIPQLYFQVAKESLCAE
ncbi:hypothetical protein PENTCL1PPCAC_130 [Pristionchus entomophagus]|uniref:PHR domain-containing protein n=1 Tax=Pristionchus entomophagus TaxID=358040 RepID=A0AAV5SCT4_9BILA|nr:hypothetical protein PENTCL1PPCAC_130 [Pristionchus entomophagus]